MSAHRLDLDKFRAIFPEFADTASYRDARITLCGTLAVSYICPQDGPLIKDDALQSALELMTAHLVFLMSQGAASPAGNSAGGGSGVLTSATIDKVTVEMAPPPFKDGWQYWLSQSPYGLSFRALLKAQSSGGWHIGGLPERWPFRKVGGIF